MLGIRVEVFGRMGGFDESFPVNYNDVDLCLRVPEAGLSVVCLNAGKIVHRESQTRVGGTRYEERAALYKRWAGILSRPDEFYSPHLAATERIALRLGGNPLEKLSPTLVADR
jgi:GT2 family glycosyltransferase